MISQASVLMATPIALLATANGTDLSEEVGDVIKGLNATTASINGFTEDNIAVELPDFTRIVDDHTFFMDESTTIIAEHIRNALDTISTTVKPILKCIEDKLKSELDPSNVAESVFSYLNVEMVNVEPAFLNSHFYPTSMPATFEGQGTVKLTDLIRGTYPQKSAEELSELVAVNVPEIAAFLNNPQEIKSVYDTLFVEKNWYEIFDGGAIREGVATVRDVANYKFGSFRTLVIASLLLNKLVATEDPIEGVSGVGLSDYRASLRLTRDMLDSMLYMFKVVWNDRAAAGIVVISDNVKYQVPEYGNMKGCETLTGSLTIGYNNAVLEMFASTEQMSLSEFAVGFLYAKQRGYQVKDIITDRDVVVSAWLEYCSNARAAMFTQKSSIATKIFHQVLEGLFADDKYKGFIETIDDQVYPSQRIISRVLNKLQPEGLFGNIPLLDAIVRGENSLMNTPLAGVLAGAFDSPIAEEILVRNADAPAGSLEQQRKHLSRAITDILLERLIPGA